jgi:two-component system nitrate/nitrite sensor histidine kinase NarX
MINTIDSTDDWNKDTLKFLYKITCAINSAENTPALLDDLLKLITNNAGGFGAIIRLISEEDWMDLLASYGIAEEHLTNLQKTSIDGYLFIHESHPIKEIRRSSASELVSAINADVISIPVRHQIHTLGVLNIFVEPGKIKLDDETALMLLAIGQHIGLIIEKNRLDELAKQKLIHEERNMLANELHDSLAQTLASLRFQVRILDETLQPTSEYMAITGIENVENNLDEAYSDLRELIAHCRVPVEKQGLIPSIEKVVNKFRNETKIHILLQCEGHVIDIPATMEMNAYRIVQEALNNIKKHSNAHIVRVLLDCDEHGNFRILVENDGKGFDRDAIKDKAGQHLGLTIMQERARHLGGELKVESEPDEGTRVELKFQYLREQPSQ